MAKGEQVPAGSIIMLSRQWRYRGHTWQKPLVVTTASIASGDTAPRNTELSSDAVERLHLPHAAISVPRQSVASGIYEATFCFFA